VVVLPTWTRVHVPLLLKVPAPLDPKLTVPPGALFGPVSVSLTVALQVVVALRATGLVQVVDVDVLRLMVTANVPLLPWCTLSPP
jgi:hypothetical protein